MNGCLEETDIPEWRIKGKTTMIQKETQKGTAQTTTDPERAISSNLEGDLLPR